MSTTALSGLLGRLNHVAIACPNLEKASQFYKNLGAEVSDPVVSLLCSCLSLISLFQPQKEHGVYTVFVNLGNSKIELLHPYGEKSPIANFLEKNKAGGIHHVCIEVRNIDEAIKTVKGLGIRTLGDNWKIGAHGKPVIFLHPKDCLGVLTELEQV